MARINFDHVAISDLLKQSLRDPESYDLDERLDYYSLDPETRRTISEEARLSAPVFGQPNLMAYVFEQVGLERTELEEEVIPRVFTLQSKKLAEYVREAGGRVVGVNPNEYERTSIDLMAIGKHLISHESRTVMYGQDYHTWGDEGPLSVRRFETPVVADLMIDGLLNAQSDLERARHVLSPAS